MDLYEDDGETISRYNFKTTIQSLITMFIVLTGENWNEIMIQVIDNTGKFLGPGLLFIILMMLGNFMLLNLFLAILLKSISSDHDEEALEAKKVEQPVVQAHHHHYGNEGKDDADGSRCSDSNSNIDQEVENIMHDLMMQSPKMQALRR